MLRDLQQQFLTAYLADENDIGSNKEGFLDQIRQSTLLSAKKRFAIYRDGITAALGHALRDIFPVCEALIGEACFRQVSYRFAQEIPSNSPNLYDYGVYFPAFISTLSAFVPLPYLKDVCDVEWAVHLAFCGQEAMPLDVGAFAQLNEEQRQSLTLSLVKNGTLLRSDYPVHRIWQVNQPEYEGEGIVRLQEGSVNLLIWRQETDVMMEALTDAQWQYLSDITRGLSIVACTEHLLTNFPNIDVATLIQNVFYSGWVSYP